MKKALSAVLAVVLVLGVCFSVPMVVNATDADKFTYELDNAENPTGYIITGVKDGVTGPVEIPATYQPAEDVVLFPTTPAEHNDGETLTITLPGPDGVVTGGKVECAVADNAALAQGVTVNVTITPDDGYELATLTYTEAVAEATAQTIAKTDGKYTFTMPANSVTISATFTKVNYTITVSDAIENGSVAVVDDKTTATMGEEIELTNTPDNGYDFVAYSVNEGAVTVTDGKFKMPAGNVTISATFEKEPEQYAVTVADDIQNGTVTVAPTTAIAGADVVVTATPATVEGKKYVVKTVSYTYVEGESAKTETVVANEGVYSFKMPTAAVEVTATFVEVFAITGVDTVTGKVTANVAEAEANAKVTLTVDPEDGYQLVADSLKVMNGETEVELAADNSFTMPAAAVTVTAEFEAIEYKAEVATGIINGKVEATAVRGEDKVEVEDLTKLNIGDTVTLALTIDKGCELKANSLQVSYIDGEETKTVPLTTVKANEEYTFSMPAANVTISAQIIPSSLPVVGIKAGAFDDATGVTAFTVHADQTRFVAKDGVLFEKVAGTEGAADTLKLIAFPANYTVAENAAKTYTIPAKVDTLDVTAVADGAFQDLGNVEYVFCADADVDIEELMQPAFYTTSEGEEGATVKTSNKKFHTTANHTEGTGYTKTAATCMKAGVTAYKCTYCEAELRTEPIAINADAHTYGEWNVITEATCLVKGTRQHTCINTDDTNTCGHIETEILEKTQHNWSTEFTVDTKPTCEDGDANTVNTGSKSKHCLTPGCDAKTEVTTIDALTHTITDNGTNENITAKKDATCEEAGFVTGNCDYCKEVVTINYEKLTHKYKVVVDVEPTCTANGWQHEECEYCGEYEDGSDMELKAPGHIAATVKVDDDTTELKWTVVKAPTCSEDGFAEVRCENCGIQMVDPEGEIEYTRVLPATGKHDFGKTWTVTKAATCEEEGEETGTCACGYTETRKIDALGHDIEGVDFTVDTEATCKDNGSKSKHCKRCDEKLEVTPITVKGAHKLAEGAKTTTPATCYSEGVMTGTCTVCGSTTATVEIPTLDHNWAETAVNLKADIEGTIQDTNEDGTPKVDEDGKPVMVPYTYEAPTCEDEGYQAIYCTNKDCPTSIIKEGSLVKVDALGHKFNDTHNAGIPANKEATCKEAGYMFKWCDTCSESNKENENKGYVKIELAKKDHVWKTTAENLRAPITIQVPKVVDGKVELGKDGKPVMVDKQVSAPTCEKTGYTAIYCENYATCGELKDVTEVGARGHLYDEAKWVKVSDATCMAKEVQSNTCLRTDCDDPDKTQTREYGDFAAHNYATTYTYEYQTCEEDGRKYYACKTTLDGKQCEAVSGVEVLEALGHKHADDAKFVGTDATCTENGEKVKECLNLFDKETGKPYEEPATPTPADDGDTTTGTEGGTTTTTRPAAPTGYEYCAGYKVVTLATGHKFADTYTEDLAATCEVPGKESRHCTNEDCTAKTGTKDIPALGHNYSTDYETITPATCKAEGLEARCCTNDDCEEYEYERKLAKTGHSYDDENGWVVDTRATCTTKGSKHNDCKVCGEAGRKTAEIAELGHDIANATLQVDPATCYKDGKKYKICERIEATTGENGAVTYAPCGDEVVIEELKQLEHSWATAEEETEIIKTTAKPADAATVEKAATCLTDGYAYKWCKNCKDWVGVEIDALGHKYDTEPTRTEPTCYKEGKLVGTCTRTGCTAEAGKAEQSLPMIDHTWGDWEMNIDSTTGEAYDDCTKTGSLIRKCTVKACGASDEPTENKAHTESGWILDSEATCGVNGKMHTECTVCKKVTAEQTIYATGEHDYEEVVTKEPTCNTPGSKTVKCKVKGCPEATEKTVSIDPVDHTFTDWKVFVEPTCTEKGIRQSVCTVCLTTKSEKILALGHDLGKDVITAPTCTVEGSKHQECSRCDYKTEATSIDALGHNYTTSNTCSAEGCEAKLYEYKLIGESTTDIEITKYNPDSKNVVKNVVIPAEIDGYVVKAIGDRAFMNIVDVPGAVIDEETGERAQATTKCEKSAIETVTIPETVTTIGAYAFASASENFKSVVIPGTVTTIGDYAFGYNATITWVEDKDAVVEEGETRPLIETITATTVNKEETTDEAGNVIPEFTFAIYGVKDSAAAVYAAQDPEKDTDDFKFAAIADVYEVEIPEEFAEVAEKAGSTVLFKEFKVYEKDDPNEKDIAEQIAAVVDINAAGYTVEVEASQSYNVMEKDEDGKDTDVVKETLNFYGTGTKVFVKDNLGNVVDVIEIAVQGDVNGDGAIDALDCMLIQLAAAANSTRPLEGVYYTAGNITADSAITADDLSAAVLKIFGEDLIVEEEEETTVTTTAPSTTEPTTQAPASTEPSTEGTSEDTSVDASEDASEGESESTTQKVEESDTTTTTTTQAPATSESASDTPVEG